MTALYFSEPRLAGTVKFHSTVPVDKIVDLMTEMHESAPERWVDLHVRPAGDDGMHYLAFQYILADDDPRSFTRAVHKLLAFLRRRLGTTYEPGKRSSVIPVGVKVWSISNILVRAA